jgi:high-affinity iron transporter
MLPTFVIGLREGVEASLIVGIIAAFMRQEGRRDMLRNVWLGVGLATAICLAVGIALDVLNSELPQRQQEMLETVVGVLAVGVVSFMILWMTRHARGLRKELEASAATALATGSAAALVGMAFFAVLREGLETAVFLLAIFQDASDPASAGIGAVLGILVAILIGVGIYRGGVKLNLARFFRLTSVVLVVVAAGLLATAAGTAWEAGWITSFQSQPLDLSWLVVPGTWTSSLLTGMLGLQPHPSVAQIVVYLAYGVPMGLYVLWPRGRSLRRARSQKAGTVGARTTA